MVIAGNEVEYALPEDVPPSKGSPLPSKGDLSPSKGDFSPSKDDFSPSKDDFSPSKDDFSPSKDGGLSPSKDDSLPSKDDSLPSKDDSLPSKDDSLPSKDDPSPSKGGLSPSKGNGMTIPADSLKDELEKPKVMFMFLEITFVITHVSKNIIIIIFETFNNFNICKFLFVSIHTVRLFLFLNNTYYRFNV